ncbi:hypothetical protein ACIBTP_34540 [Streptomyces avidinii]
MASATRPAIGYGYEWTDRFDAGGAAVARPPPSGPGSRLTSPF